MACALTQGYTIGCRNSRGGVKNVWVIEKDNATLTEATGVISTITLETGKFWRKYEVEVQTADSNSNGTHNREMGTSFYDHEVKFPINKLTTAVRDEIKLLAQNRLFFVVEDNNGTKWLYGRENGLMLATDANKTGVKYGDRNGRELVFNGQEFEDAIAVTASIVTS